MNPSRDENPYAAPETVALDPNHRRRIYSRWYAVVWIGRALLIGSFVIPWVAQISPGQTILIAAVLAFSLGAILVGIGGIGCYYNEKITE
jgi:hypothetical protein